MNRSIYIIILLALFSSLGYSQVREKKQKQTPSKIDPVYEKDDIGRNIRLVNASWINTPRMEFSPAFYQGGLVYVSQKSNGLVDEKTGQRFYELFFADLDPNGMPVRPSNFSIEINSELHEGPVALNRQYDRIYFTRSNIKNGVTKAGTDKKVNLKIFEAKRGEFDWEGLEELPFNNDNYTCMHPALSPDGNKLFFASNQPGGFGGMDLYVVEKKEGRWGKPFNLGPEINTGGNEVFPFLHESGTLFFTSDGHKGYGGLDIFMVDLAGRKWGSVMNLGQPFNSKEDDLGLILSKDGKTGYFTSNRPGGAGGDDIYFFETPDGIRGMKIPETHELVVTVYDGGASRRIPGANLRIYNRTDDGLIDDQNLYDLELLPSEAYGEMVMKLVRKKEQFLGDPDVKTDRLGEGVLSVEQDHKYVILVSKDGYASKEIAYTVDEEEMPKPLEVVLDPQNCIELTGKVRSSAGKKEIAGALVRIINQCDETEILSRTKFDGVFTACLELGCEYTIISEHNNYSPELTRISLQNLRGRRYAEVEMEMEPMDEFSEKEPIRKGTVIVLENIYYDFNKSAIRRGAARELDGLVRLMDQYKSMVIRLGSHTDCRGSDEYNLKLSEKRAESAKQYLVDRGIAAERVKTIGYGETQPRNRCDCRTNVDCTEAEHQYNRRTEVRIISIDETVTVDYRR
ncbi:MAG: PD40 domain-containing protein [Lewinella sp.]|nr:PD40 domain-containing protein [Lewinella sp.]